MVVLKRIGLLVLLGGVIASACGKDGSTIIIICDDAGTCPTTFGGSNPGSGGSADPGSGGTNNSGGTGSSDGGSNNAGGSTGNGGAQTSGGSAGASAGGSVGSGGSANVSGTVFFDDFADGNADGWLNDNVGPDGGGVGIWSVISGVYNQSIDTDTTSHIAFVSGTWTDMTVEARVKMNSITGAESSYYVGLCGRYLDNDNYYCGALRHDGDFSLRARLEGSTNTLGTHYPVVPPITTGVWYTMKIQLQGTTISGYLDGVLIASEIDSTVPSGGVALITAGTSADFDDVRVTVP